MIEAIKNLKKQRLSYSQFCSFLDEIFTLSINGDDQNLSIIATIHTFLLKSVIMIHNNENSCYNSNVFESNISFRATSTKVEDKKRADRIYFIDGSLLINYFIGDLHSDIVSLKQILKKTNFFKDQSTNLIFLGDYIDRGKHHYKTIETILLLKYLFPKRVFLLKGNHDSGKLLDEPHLEVGRSLNSKDNEYFILDLYQYVSKGYSLEAYKLFLEFFNSLAIIAILKVEDKIIMGVHAGLPRPKRLKYYNHIKSIKDFSSSAKDLYDMSIYDCMIWSDPMSGTNDKSIGRGRFRFFENHFNEFVSRFDIDYLVRGHFVYKMGYEFFYQQRLISIFSSGKNNDSSAYPKVEPKIAKFNKNTITIVNIYD